MDNEFIENDYTLFDEYCLAAINISTGTHADYHKIIDTSDKINYTGMYLLYDWICNFLK